MAPNQTTVVEIEGSVAWEFARDPESETWIGVCRQLNLNAIGDTWGELLECAQQAMMLLFEDLVATNEFNQFLRQNGWNVSTHRVTPGDDVRYAMPFEVHRAGSARELAAYA